MIAIDFRISQWQWEYQVSTTFSILIILPTLYYLYEKYITKKPNRHNKKEEPVKVNVPLPEEAKLHWKGKRLYPPHLNITMSKEPEKLQSYCPATGQSLGTFNVTNRDDIDAMISKARIAQEEWGKSSFSTRTKLLKILRLYILDHQEDIARVACRDSGKTKVDASMGEIMVTLEKLSWIIAHGESTLRTSKRAGPSHRLVGLMKNGEIRYEPLGVVAAIVSWNYPFHNLMGPIIASLFTGNAIVVKCSEQVVWSSRWFIDSVRISLKTLDLDPNLVQLVYCFPEDADYFTSHSGLDHLTFIGSRSVAKKVAASAAQSLTPCVVELGGKDAVIVLDDITDSQSLSSLLMRGVFQSAGQNCIGIERIICLPKIYDTLVRIFTERVPKLRVGSDIDQLDEIDVGALISNNRFDYMESLIRDAVRKGAKLICGGKAYQHPNYPQGHYFEPTLIIDVTPEMKLFQEELFGPILTMIRAQDADEAVNLANATEYGLGSSVFAKRFSQANDIANRLKSGNVAINDFATYYVAQLPFGGIKGSGYGKFGGEEGLLGLCVAKSVAMDKPILRALSVATSIPPQLDYPIANDKAAWNFLRSLNKAGYENRIWEVVKAFRQLASKPKQN